MQRLVGQKRANPADDLLSGLVHDADPPLTDTQLSTSRSSCSARATRRPPTSSA